MYFDLSIKIKDLPEAERPYEKLELYGEKALSNAELLAIIIKTGTKEETSVQVAQRILKLRQNGENDLTFLQKISIADLTKIKGIGKVKAIQIKAISELAVRMSKPDNYKGIYIKNSKEVAQMFFGEFQNEKKEIAKIVLLDNKLKIIKIEEIAVGGSNFVDIGIKTIVKSAMQVEAAKVILVHNHPSGIAEPSKGDIKFTDKLFNALAIFEIDLYDTIIIGSNNQYASVYEHIKKQLEATKTK